MSWSLADWALLVVNATMLCIIVIVPVTIFIIRWNEARARDRDTTRAQTIWDLHDGLIQKERRDRLIEAACSEYEEALRGAEIMKELEEHND